MILVLEALKEILKFFLQKMPKSQKSTGHKHQTPIHFAPSGCLSGWHFKHLRRQASKDGPHGS